MDRIVKLMSGMEITGESWFLSAALFNLLAALLHVGCIVFGAPWYRFFGAGEKMASMAEAGKWFPYLVTAAIVFVLLVWVGYALSGAGTIGPWPLLKPALMAICGVYLIRGLGGFWLVYAPMPDQSATFAFWSSLLCTSIGLMHLIGLIKLWPSL